MATRGENQKIEELQKDVGGLKTDVAVIKNDMGYIKSSAEKMDKFIEDNKGGITFSSVLNSKVVTVFIAGIVAAGVFFASRIGGGQ